MDIRQFISYINRAKGWHIEGHYYSYIDTWRQWWRGYYPDFHLVRYTGQDGNPHTRERYRLRMPKRLCEDWASLLLNDKTTVTVDDEASANWLCGGVDSQQTGGLLGALDFWPNANRLVELAFRSGTGAFVLSACDVSTQDGRLVATPGASLALDYLPAECILPVTVQHGQITEVAFASEVTADGLSCVYLQTHRLVTSSDGVREYEITNEYYISDSEDSEGASYRPEKLPPGMLSRFRTGSARPWFAIFSPAAVKNLDGGPGLGVAVFAEALDACRLVDLAFDNYCQDILLGGKKVFYNRSMLKPILTPGGGTAYIAPDALGNQLFWAGTEDMGGDDKPFWREYNPDLRTQSNGQAIQDALNYASFLVGLGTHRYQFQAGTIATATQYMGDRQDMVQHANRHQIAIEAALRTLFGTLLWAGRALLGQPVNPDAAISIHFDDSYFDTAESRRQQDKDDCLSGFLPRYRYNMEWRGMSKEEAQAAVREAQEELTAGPALTFGDV